MMNLLLLFSFFHVSMLQSGCAVQYDGIYKTQSVDNPQYHTYLQFYQDGTVLIADSDMSLDDVLIWLKKENTTIASTNWKIKKCTIDFTLKLEDAKITYSGK